MAEQELVSRGVIRRRWGKRRRAVQPGELPKWGVLHANLPPESSSTQTSYLKNVADRGEGTPVPFTGWAFPHPAAPWELNLEIDQYRILAEHSKYFSMMRDIHMGTVENHIKSANQQTGVIDFDIPLYTNSPAADVISPWKTLGLTYTGGEQKGTDLDASTNRDTGVSKFCLNYKNNMMIHLGHLLMSIVILVFYRGVPSPFDEIMGNEILSFVNIARFLGAPYILKHMAQFVINERKVAFFRVQARKILIFDLDIFEDLLEILRNENNKLYDAGFDEWALRVMEEKQSPNRALHASWRFWMRNYMGFWEHQRNVNCPFCGCYLITGNLGCVDNPIEIMECCLYIACRTCYRRFLQSTHKCIHIPLCENLLTCYVYQNPFAVPHLKIGKCPNCFAGYTRGLFSWRHTRRASLMTVVAARGNHSYNERLLFQNYKGRFISNLLRRVCNHNYPYRGQVTLDPYNEMLLQQ